MGTFKEPQPRKVSIQEEHEAKQRRFPNPSPAEQSLLDQTQPPAYPRVHDAECCDSDGPCEYESYAMDVTIRTAALQAAATLQRSDNDNGLFWRNISALEKYLRTGKTL